MIGPKQINDLVQDVLSAMPIGLRSLPNEIQRNLHSALQSTFQKANLVTREEFDAQVRVLQKTRQKLEMLEKKLAELEAEHTAR